MKKYTVYAMSLLILAGITNSPLQAAAAPRSAAGGEQEEKELGGTAGLLARVRQRYPMEPGYNSVQARFEEYKRLKKEILELSDKDSRCQAEKNYQAVVTYYQDSYVRNREWLERPGAGARNQVGGYNDRSSDIRNLYYQIAKKKKEIAGKKRQLRWARLSSFGRKGAAIPIVPVAQIGKLTREMYELEKSFNPCAVKLAELEQKRAENDQAINLEADKRTYPDSIFPHILSENIKNADKKRSKDAVVNDLEAALKRLEFENYELDLKLEQLDLTTY